MKNVAYVLISTIFCFMTNAAGYYPGPVAPSTAEGAPLSSIRYKHNARWHHLYWMKNVANVLISTIFCFMTNAAGYHTGAVAPSTAEGAPLSSIRYWHNARWHHLYRIKSVPFCSIRTYFIMWKLQHAIIREPYSWRSPILHTSYHLITEVRQATWKWWWHKW